MNKSTQDEITRQLQELKRTLDNEVLSDFRELRRVILAEVKDLVVNEVKNTVATEVKTQLATQARLTTETVTSSVTQSLRKEMAEVVNTNNQLVAMNNKQLANATTMNKEVCKAICEQASQYAYNTVISEINEKIVPKVDNMMRWVSYQTQDTTELITDYRKIGRAHV